MKAFSFLSILKNFGKQLSSLASQMPWCNLRFNLGSMSVLSRVNPLFSRTSSGTSFGTSFGTSRRASHFAAILTILFTIGVGSVWGETVTYTFNSSSVISDNFYETKSNATNVVVTANVNSPGGDYTDKVLQVALNNNSNLEYTLVTKVPFDDISNITFNFGTGGSARDAIYIGVDISSTSDFSSDVTNVYDYSSLWKDSYKTYKGSEPDNSKIYTVSKNVQEKSGYIRFRIKNRSSGKTAYLGNITITSSTSVSGGNEDAESCETHVWYNNGAPEGATQATCFTFTKTPSGTNSQNASMTIDGKAYINTTRSSDWNSDINFNLTADQTATFYIYAKGTGSRTVTLTNGSDTKTFNMGTSFNTFSSEGLTEGNWKVTVNGNIHISMVALHVCTASAPSCTAPENVAISGEYVHFPGENLTLNVSGDNIAQDATYTWKKGDQVIAGQTTATLTINSCEITDAGNYTCTVSNGNGCEATADFTIKMYRLRGLTDDINNWSTNFVFEKADGKTATYLMDLEANSSYQFKVHDGSAYYGNEGNNPTMTSTNCTNWTMKENSGNNVTLQTTFAGTYTFTLDYTDASNPTISVTYPQKQMVYLNPNMWDADDATEVYTVYSWVDENNKAFTEMTKVNECENVYQALIDIAHTQLLFIRGDKAFNSWDGNRWNQSIDLTCQADGLYIIDAWENDGNEYWKEGAKKSWASSSGTYTPATYSITFNGNGNTDGSMTNVTGITCGEDRTLAENGFARTGYTFAGWKANVNVTIGGSTVTAGTVIANSATIQNISQNITLTAQWTAKTCNITFDKESGSGGSDNVTATYGSAMPSITKPTRVGYTFEGYWDGDNGTGNQYYKADGTSAQNWDKEAATATLYAKWTQMIVSVESVEVAPSSKTIEIDATQQLTATIEPNDATNKNITWSSSNESVATVDENGWVTAVAAGKATITATTEDGNKTDQCEITVEKIQPEKYDFSIDKTELCGDEKATLTLVNSQSNVTYELRENSSTPIADTEKQGTGSALTWNVGAGTYVVYAKETDKYSERQMDGSKITISNGTATSITTQPTTSVAATVGSACSITGLVAAGTSPTYQWYTCNSDGSSATEIDAAGTLSFTGYTTATLGLTPTATGATYYKCVVSGSCGDPVTSSVVTVNATAAAGDCHKYFYYCALTTPSPAPTKNENSFFSNVPGDGSALSGSWEIDNVTYTTSNRCSNSANIGTFTVPSGKVATMYVMFNGGSSHTMTIKKGGSNYKTRIDASSGIKKYTEKDMGPGTYAVTTSGNVGLLLLIVDVCDDGPDVTAPTFVSSNPANGATSVATSGTIVLTFSEALGSVDASKFTLTGATKVAVAIDGSDATKVNIAYSGAANEATVTLATDAAAVSDVAGNALAAALSNISFTTEAAALKEPTVTWSDVPATVYPGQQFVFTVETNTDATLNVSNLAATNATLVNNSIEGGVFTATAQIAADAAAAPTFTLSTVEGTSYAAKDDTKSGITLGSCESSSGTATLFAFTCTSTTTATDTYSATGGTAMLSNNAMPTGGSNEITISGQTYYKFSSSSLWTMTLSSGTFAAGDVITFTMACNTGSDKEGKGVNLNGSIAVTTDYPKNTAQESSYTVTAGDGIAGQSSFTIKRNDSDIKFGSVTVTRAGQSLDNKQETTIEWPETVDGVRVVEYEEGLKVPSLAIISSIGEATYTSNNEDVGSFRDGKVELIGVGNVTITVSVAAAGCMEAAESSYVLTVIPKRYTVEKGTITAGCDVTLSATSVSSGEVVTLTPVPADGYSLTSWDVYKKGDSSTKVTVTNNRFTMPEYDVVVNATFTAKSTVATLSALSVTNADTEEAVTLSPTFASGTTAYTATLSCGTTSAPRISATKTDSKATTRLTNVSDLKGDAAACTATIVVTAEDGVTTRTYTIVFTVSEDGCVRLAPSITSISEDEDICSGGSADLSVTAESRNNDGGTLSYQWQKYNGASWDNITGATEADYTTEAITVNSKFRCVVSDTKDEDVKSTTSDEITIGVTSVDIPTYTQGANVVTLSCATEGATIWYSTDGNDPAAGADNSRQGMSVSITRTGVTVKAIAYLDGCHSDVMTLTNADYSSGAVDGSIIWSMNNAGEKEAPKFNVTCVPNTVLSAATAFTMRNDADYDMSTKTGMSVKISGITSYSADGKHVSLDVTVADGYTFTPSSLCVTYQPVGKDAKYKAVIGSNTSSESSSVSAGDTGTKTVNFSTPSAISGTQALHLYVYGTDLTRWRLAGDIILYGTVQTTGTTYYSVTYNRNGATSGTVPQDDNLYTSGQIVELAANTGGLAKDGYIFSGWSTTADGTALTENPTITDDMTLYAVWTEDESLVTEVCADVSTSGTYTSIAVGGYNLYFSSSKDEYSSGSVKSNTANKCDGTCRYYMPGVVVALTNSNATTIKLKGQQDYDVTVSKVMVADALDGAWREISYTPIAYSSSSCGVLGISGVQIAQGKYVFLGFSGGAKNEFRISGLCITPFTDLCPSISIAKNPVGDTWAKDATVQISVGATTDAGVLSYQWQVSTDNTNFSDIDAATGTTYDVPTGTVGTKYYRCVVSNGSCSKNSESAKIVIVEPTVTALYEYWYIKQGRMTPDIALFEVTKGTPASNVTIPAAEIGKYGFVYNTSDYKIYLQGSAPSAIYSDEDVEVTASIKSNSNADNITLHLLRATPHPQLAFVVTGDKGAGFENYEESQTTCDLYTQLALDYIIQPTNVYHTTDEKAIRAYYSQFDIILNTDFPDTQKGPNSDKGQWNVGYVNALGAMVDIVPILTMEAFVSRLPNWKIKHDPKSPSTKQYSMLLNCRAHEIFGGIPDGHMGTEIINGEEHKVVTIVDENNYTGGDALQGFSADELSDMDIVGQIHNGSGQLMACVERQYETTARMMVLGINSAAMVKLTEDGIKVVKNALIYLQRKSARDVNDCSLRFDNKEGDHQWTTVGNWAPGYSTLPTYENKVIILADCELNTLAHVDMAKINEDVKLTIKPTGALIVDGTITRFGGEDWLAQEGEITPDNLAIEADENNTGALILSNPEGKIGAKVQMYSKSYWETVDGKKKKYWSYVGVPIANVDIPNYFNQGFTYLYTETAGWEKKWDGSVLQPFEGIGLSMQSGHKETFYGNLASTLSRKIALTHGSTGENLIGNSWTAPIQIANFEEADFGGATAAVYVYNTGRDEQASGSTGTASYGGNNSETAGQWVSVPVETAKEGGYTGLKVIPAMNAFQVNTTAAATLTLDYDKLVRKNAASNGDINDPMRAPRRAALKRIDALMRIRVSGEKTHTDIWLQQDERFTEGFDNGWEAVYAECDNRSAQLYAVSMLGQMSFIAKPYLEGTPIGFAPSRDGNIYTFSFQYDGEEVYYLNDLKEQKSTLIEADETYTFTYEEGEMSPRFLISVTPFESPAITTGMENLDAAAPKVQKIIYNDKLYIIRGGRLYDATGKVVK